MDSRDRDKFYLSVPDDDNGDDYEIEPPDADVIAAEERRGQEAIEASKVSIDIDEIYRDAGRQRSDEILESWVQKVRERGFRFQVKHLLIATAVLAIAMTFAHHGLLGTAVVVLIMISIAALYFYMNWQEQKAEEAAERRVEEMYARKRAHHEKKSRGPITAEEAEVERESAAQPPPDAGSQTWQDASPREAFQFRFSMKELLIAMTTAAVVFGLVHIFGSASSAATLLGFVALFGLIVHALGFEPPSIVVLGWWLILVLYVSLSIFAATWNSMT
jgi:hypothetical protein